MTIYTETITQHVTRAVANHDFLNAADWAAGLSELADFGDAEIETLTDNEYPAVSLIEVSPVFLSGLRRHLCRCYGISIAQARADRALFNRAVLS